MRGSSSLRSRLLFLAVKLPAEGVRYTLPTKPEDLSTPLSEFSMFGVLITLMQKGAHTATMVLESGSDSHEVIILLISSKCKNYIIILF